MHNEIPSDDWDSLEIVLFYGWWKIGGKSAGKRRKEVVDESGGCGERVLKVKGKFYALVGWKLGLGAWLMLLRKCERVTTTTFSLLCNKGHICLCFQMLIMMKIMTISATLVGLITVIMETLASLQVAI